MKGAGGRRGWGEHREGKGASESKARKRGVGCEKIWKELEGEVETSVLALQEGLGGSNGLEDTHRGLKSLVKYRDLMKGMLKVR